MLVGRSGLSPVMVGRAPELDRLAGLVGAGAAPAVALLAGEAGIGKTRLVQELVSRVGSSARVLVGQADPGALGRPLELLLDAVDVIPGVDPDLLEAAADDARPAEERILAGHEIVRRLADLGPTVVVFEDLHWADAQSLALFERLAEPDVGPVLLVGTYRPDALSRRHPATEVLPRLERRHSVTHVRLDRLRPSEVADFLAAVYGRPPSYRIVEALHARTGGNPFFLEQLLAAASSDDVEALISQPLPWNLTEAIRGQLDDLPPGEREVLEAAAVLGQKVEFDTLAAVTGSGEEELIAVLRTLVERGLMVEAEADVFAFRHALAREAVEEGLLGREKRRLHQAALDALQKTEDLDHAAVARHAHGAGRYEDMVAAALAGARRYLELGSPYQALQLTELGLSEADDDIELLGLATQSAWLAGLVHDAIVHCDRWLAVARRRADTTEVSAALRARARLAWESGDLETLARVTDEILATLELLDSDDERARAMAALAQSHMLREETDEACAWADRALELADRLDRTDLRLAALVEKGSALTDQRGFAQAGDDGARILLEVVEAGEPAGEHLVVARALNNLIWHERATSDPAQVRTWLERMRAAAERAGFDPLAGAGYALAAAGIATLEGDLQAAIDHLDDGRRRDRAHLLSSKSLWYTTTQAGYALEAGDLDAAAAHTAETPLTGRTRASVAGLRLHLACRRGDLAGAREALAQVLAAAEADGNLYPSQVHDLLSAGLQAGLSTAELRPLTEWAGHRSGELLSPTDPWRALLDAQLAEANGDSESAATGYAVAAEQIPMNLEILPAVRGSAHVGAARCLIALNRLDEARVHTARAADILARWAGWRVAELVAVQRRLGMGDRPAGPATLTPREREVAVLLAEGLSNAELAERLYISPKTAAVHVSNILSKLQMGSRTEAAAWAVREGLTGDGQTAADRAS